MPPSVLKAGLGVANHREESSALFQRPQIDQPRCSISSTRAKVVWSSQAFFGVKGWKVKPLRRKKRQSEEVFFFLLRGSWRKKRIEDEWRLSKRKLSQFLCFESLSPMTRAEKRDSQIREKEVCDCAEIRSALTKLKRLRRETSSSVNGFCSPSSLVPVPTLIRTRYSRLPIESSLRSQFLLWILEGKQLGVTADMVLHHDNVL